MMYRTLFDSAGVLLLATVLMCTTTTTAAQPLTTDATAHNDATSIATNESFVDFIMPNETGILEQFAVYTGSEFPEQETTISGPIVPDTEETSQSTSTASVSKLNSIYNTPDQPENTTSYTHGTASHAQLFNTTLPTEEEGSLKKKAASLEIAVIVLGIIAGLSIICIIILVTCLIIQKRQRKTLQTESLMEISKHERQLPKDNCLAVTIMSSNDGIDSGSRDRSQKAGLSTPAESTEIHIESDSNVGVSRSNPTDNVCSNENDTYVNYNHNINDYVNPRSQHNSYINLRSLNNEGANPRSQNNVYGNWRSENNEHVSDSSQNDEIYNNTRGGMNQKHIHPQERRI